MVRSQVQHRQGIDLARFIAAFAVVAAHVFAAENGWIGHLAVAAFLILAALLAVQSLQRAGEVYDWARRAPRILVPWLFWCAVYKIVLVKVTDGPEKFALLTDPWSLLVGPFIHLWFLPFVLVASLCVQPVGRRVQSVRDIMLGSAVLAVLGVAAFWVSDTAGFPMPLPQWISSLPSFGYGLLAGFAVAFGGAVWPMLAMVGLCGVSFALLGELWVLQPLIAAVLIWGAWRLPVQGRVLPHLGQVAFGIYLTHPFFLLVCFKLFGAEINAWLALVLTFGMAWGATVLLRATPFLRRMV
jgi:peptidoglycan/LPS O-acetylase OafA/YrhL